MIATDFYELPEGCVSNILSLTSPPDACRLSLVASIFRAAAESDAVWERFLPSDYESIISRSDGSDNIVLNPKKQLYLRLCDTPLLIDGGMKSFFLNKWSGKKCYMIAARELTIIWGDTPSYWKWISLPKSRFAEVAELRMVCWLEIRGKISTSMLSLETTYAAYLVFKFASHGYGFENQQIEASVGIVGGECSTHSVCLDPDGVMHSQSQMVPRRVGIFSRIRPQILATEAPPQPSGIVGGRSLMQREDGWLEVEMGECYISGKDEELEMSLMEVNNGAWKSGLIVQGIEVRPKECK